MTPYSWKTGVDHKTPAQITRDLCLMVPALTRLNVRVAGTELSAVTLTDNQLIAVFMVTKLTSETATTESWKNGTRVVSLLLEEGDWSVLMDKTIWSGTSSQHRYDQSRNSPTQYLERIEWERDCYRPGNATRLGVRDSWAREVEGYISSTGDIVGSPITASRSYR